MSQIHCLYEVEPTFPATDQHPDAARFAVSAGIFRFCDAVGGEPTQAELDAHLGVDAAGLALKARRDQDGAEVGDCAVDPQVLPLINQTKAEWIAWAESNFPTLTAAERTRLGILFWVVAVGVRSKLR
jgi:hypothetical protein